MKKVKARFRSIGGLVAGALVGLALLLPLFLPAIPGTDQGEILLLIVSIILFATGIALRAVVSTGASAISPGEG